MKLDGSMAIACSKSVSASCSFPAVHQDLALMNVRGRRQEPHKLSRRAVAKLGGLQFPGLVIIVVGGYVILPSLGSFALLVEGLGLALSDEAIARQSGSHQQHCQDTGKPFHHVPKTPGNCAGPFPSRGQKDKGSGM